MKNAEKRKLFSPVTDRPHCLYCHKRLREVTHLDQEAQEAFYRRHPGWEKNQLGIPTGTFGYGGDGFFCTLTCGYHWAVQQCRAVLAGRQR